MFKFVIFLVTLVLGCKSWELPSYLTKCTCDDSLPPCFVDNVLAIKPHLKDEFEGLTIPKLVPYHIDSLILEVGKDLSIKLANIDVFDLDTYKNPSMMSNLSGQHMSFTLFFDVVHITATYEVDGKILILPIKGQGPISLTIEELNCTYAYDFKLFERDGVKYFKLPSAEFDFKYGHINMHLDNLFNGDKILGDQVNDFLNENWMEVGALLKDPISNTVQDVIYDIICEFGEKVPAEELCVFPDANVYMN